MSNLEDAQDLYSLLDREFFAKIPEVVSLSIVEGENRLSSVEVGLAERDNVLKASIGEVAGKYLGRSVDSVPCEVVTSGKIELLAIDHPLLDARGYRPALGGDRIGSQGFSTSGTLGLCIQLEGEGDAFFISCWHVLARGVASPGRAVLQPPGSPFPRDKIGELHWWLLDEQFDVAIARAIDGHVGPGTRCYGSVSGVASAANNMSVRMCGGVSGKGEGTVRSIKSKIKIEEFPSGSREFVDQIECDIEGKPGDSGAVLLNDKNAVGLAFARSLETKRTYCNPLQPLFDSAFAARTEELKDGRLVELPALEIAGVST